MINNLLSKTVAIIGCKPNKINGDKILKIKKQVTTIDIRL